MNITESKMMDLKSERERADYICKHLIQKIKEDVLKFDTRHRNLMEKYRKRDQEYIHQKRKVESLQGDIFKWLKVPSRYLLSLPSLPNLKKLLRSKLIELISKVCLK